MTITLNNRKETFSPARNEHNPNHGGEIVLILKCLSLNLTGHSFPGNPGP